LSRAHDQGKTAPAFASVRISDPTVHLDTYVVENRLNTPRSKMGQCGPRVLSAGMGISDSIRV